MLCRVWRYTALDCRPVPPAIGLLNGRLEILALQDRLGFPHLLQVVEELQKHDPGEHGQAIKVAIEPLADRARGYTSTGSSLPPLSPAPVSTTLAAVPSGGCVSFMVLLVVPGMTLASRGHGRSRRTEHPRRAFSSENQRECLSCNHSVKLSASHLNHTASAQG